MASQLVHRQTEETMGAERREVDLDALGAAAGIDDHMTGEKAGGEAAIGLVRMRYAAERDGEGRAEADDQRHDQRCNLDLAGQQAPVLLVPDDVDDNAAQLRTR